MQKKRRYLAWIMTLIMVVTLLPMECIHAADSITVSNVILGKTFNEKLDLNEIYIVIEGTGLKDASVYMNRVGGNYTRLTERDINEDSLIQFKLTAEQLGTKIRVGNMDIDINGLLLPTLQDMTRKVNIGAGNPIELFINGTELDKVHGADTDEEYILAQYGKGSTYSTIASTQFNNPEDTPNKVKITDLGSKTGFGLQNLAFIGQYKDTKSGIKVQLRYVYEDQFYIMNDLGLDEDSLEMFPNRGVVGDEVRFTSKILNNYNVFFLKNKTDDFTNANKGLNSHYSDREEEDTLTVEVPNIPVGRYYVVLTNSVSDDEDPARSVTAEYILDEQFTVIDGKKKPNISSISPNRGADTGGDTVTIKGRYILSLNTDEFKLDNTTDYPVVHKSSTDDELIIDYGSATYDTGEDTTVIENVYRRITVGIGNKAKFIKENEEYYAVFGDLDEIKVETTAVTDANTNPTKDVIIEIYTELKDKDGNNVILPIKDSVVEEGGFTFIPSTVAPEITDAVPKKIQVEGDIGDYKIPSDRYLAIYGKNFMVYKNLNETGQEVVSYPVITIGPITINKNINNEEFIKVFDDNGNEVDGSEGNEKGTKILVILKENTPVPDKYLGKASLVVENPIRNSTSMGLTATKDDFIEFVNPDPAKNPIIEDVVPNTISVDGGEKILITGSNFTDGVKVFIDGAEVKNLERGGDGKTIIFTAPPGRVGETQLQVMNEEGGMDTYPFTYVKTSTNPIITSIEPREGNTGTLVVVKGDNFLKPDPAVGKSAMNYVIGTKILLEGKEINTYNINKSSKKIELTTFDPKTPLFSIKDEVLKTADYYHSIVLEDSNGDGKLYSVDMNASGIPIISDGIGNNYKIKLNASKTKIEADKEEGDTYYISNGDGTSTNNNVIQIKKDDTVILNLTIKTPFEISNGEVIGDRVKVIDKNTIYFYVPILPADSWYDVTVQNPDTKSDTRKDEQGFYYYKQPMSKPAIGEVTPSEGTVDGNNVITIEGKAFIDNGYEKIKVFIDGVEVDSDNIQVSPSGNSMTVVVPPYNGDLMADKGVGRWAVPIVVINPDGGNASKENAYTYVIPSSNPKINNILPASGTAAGGEIVEIFGSDFRDREPFEDVDGDGDWQKGEPFTDLNGNDTYDDSFDGDYDSPLLPKVFFGMTEAKVIEFPSKDTDAGTYIKVITPKGTAGTVQVFVENNDAGRSNSVPYTYKSSNPVITKLVPPTGNKAGGGNVNVYGNGFIESDIQVYTSGTKKQDQSMVLVQFGDNTNKNIERYKSNSGLINSGYAQVSLPQDFTAVYEAVYDSPSQITVSLKYNDTVYTNTFKGFNDEESFINTNLLQNSEGRKYPYNELIKFSVVDRRFIVERGFSPEVEFSGKREYLSVTIPSYHTIGKVPISVINPDGGIGEATFEYVNPNIIPTIIDITNQEVSPVSETITIDGKDITARVIRVNYKGGNRIKVIGTDFSEDAVISIGEILDISKEQIRYDGVPYTLGFDMPAVSENYLGNYYPLIVVNKGDGGSASSSELAVPIYITFTKGESNPNGSSLTPSWGPATGGTKVTIEGSDFRETMVGFTDTIHVYFGEVPASDIAVSRDGKYLYVTTPVHEPGEVEVTVQNPDGTIITIPDTFTFISSPKIIKATDLNELTEIKTISVEGGEEIKLKGFGFKEGAAVYFNPVIKKALEGTNQDIIYIDGVPYTLESGIEAAEVEFIDEETVRVVTPEGNMDTVGVILINQDGGASNIYKGLSYSLPEVDAPQGVRADLMYDRYIKITWSEVPGAVEYEIYAVIDDENEGMVGSTKTTSFVFEDIESRTDYRFIVKAIGEFNISKGSEESNEVRTGSHVGIPDEDGKLNEETITRKNGTLAEIILGRDDEDQEITIDLTRGNLAGANEAVITMSAGAITSRYSKDITVIGRDFTLVFNPRIFTTDKMVDNRSNEDAGVRFTIAPNKGNPNLELGSTALSPSYILEASQYVGKTTGNMDYLSSSFLLNLDYDGNISRMRRLNNISFSRYDSSNGKWTSIKKTNDTDQMAIGTYVDRLGQYMVVGSRR